MGRVFASGLKLKIYKTKYGELRKLSFKIDEFKEFLDKNHDNGRVNLTEKISRKYGTPYYEVDFYSPYDNDKKTQTPTQTDTKNEVNISDIPF